MNAMISRQHPPDNLNQLKRIGDDGKSGKIKGGDLLKLFADCHLTVYLHVSEKCPEKPR